MEKDKFKKIPLTTPPQTMPDNLLETISGGKQNRDENGNWGYKHRSFRKMV